MNKIEGITKLLLWFMAILLAAVVAGCGGSGSAVQSSAKAITSYTLSLTAGSPVIASGTITGTSIAVTVPSGTDRTSMVAAFATTGTSVTVGTPAVAQVSGTTANDFTSPVVYTVTAADGSTATYTVTATEVSSSAKAITAFSLFVGSSAYPGVITEPAHTIAVTLPSGTVITALTATFTSTGTGAVTIGGATQSSGAAPTNNFTTSKSYLVTAADSTTATYVVTVTLAAAPSNCTGTTGTTGNNCVDLGTSANYVILAEAAITNVTTSAVTGDIGLYPITGAAIGLTCGEVTGVIYSANAAGPACKVTDGTGLNLAVNAKLAAYNDGFARVETAGANLNVGSGTLDATTVPSGLAPGAYVWTSAVTIPANLTLVGTNSGTDVWVFKVGGTLDVGANILLSGGALPQNVFWVTSGNVTIAAGKHMEGVVLSAGDITLITGASANGRLLSATQVVLQAATVTKP